MKENNFKYRLGKRTRNITLITIAAIILIYAGLSFSPLGEYLPAWFFSISLAVIGLAILSIPRNIRVTPEALEIRCVIEITHIPYDHIKNVRRIGRAELQRVYPVFASMGFFGYFGYYLDVRNWEIIKVYTSSWHGLVMIEDIYEQRYLVNSDRPDELIASISHECSRCTAH